MFRGPVFSNLRDHSGLSVQEVGMSKEKRQLMSQTDPIWHAIRSVIYDKSKARRYKKLRTLVKELEQARDTETFKAH